MEIKKSTRKGKKYMAYTGGHWVHFGSIINQQYRDSTPLKLYSHLDHGDRKRRENYLARAKGIKDKEGRLTYKDPSSANALSIKYLW
jgi:hypothetical protein